MPAYVGIQEPYIQLQTALDHGIGHPSGLETRYQYRITVEPGDTVMHLESYYFDTYYISIEYNVGIYKSIYINKYLL